MKRFFAYFGSLLRRIFGSIAITLFIALIAGFILVGIGFVLFFIGAGDYYLSFINDLFSLIWNYLSILATLAYIFYAYSTLKERIDQDERNSPGCNPTGVGIFIVAFVIFWGILLLQESLFDLPKYP